MPDWFLAWQRESTVNKTWDGIFSLFDFAEERSRDGLRRKYCSRSDGLVFDWRFEWLVEPGDQGVRVTETAYISRSWFLFTSLILIGFLVSFDVAVNSEGILNLVSSAISVILFGAFILTISNVFGYRGTMNDFFSGQPDSDNYHPFLLFILVMAVIILPALFLEGIVLKAAILMMMLFLLVYYFLSRSVEKFSIQWQRKYIDFLKRLPMIASDYVVLLLLLSPPTILFLLIHDMRVFQAVVLTFPYASFILYAGSVVLLFRSITVINLKHVFQVSKARFEVSGGNISTRFAFVGTGFVVLGVSLGFLYLSYRFLYASMQFLSEVSSLAGLGVVIFSGVPIVFLAGGFVYQLWSFFSGLYLLVSRMEKEELGEEYDPCVETYLLEYSGYFAGAGTFLTKDFIVVSSGLVDSLDGRELDAILAHEECHVVEGESKLAALIAVLSPLVSVGRNVVYALLGFRNREFRADRYAAEKTSRNQIISALEGLQVLEAEEKTGQDEFGSVTPTLTPVIRDSSVDLEFFLDRYYGLYFGNFAVSDVHPSLSERIKSLKERS